MQVKWRLKRAWWTFYYTSGQLLRVRTSKSCTDNVERDHMLWMFRTKGGTMQVNKVKCYSQHMFKYCMNRTETIHLGPDLQSCAVFHLALELMTIDTFSRVQCSGLSWQFVSITSTHPSSAKQHCCFDRTERLCGSLYLLCLKKLKKKKVLHLQWSTCLH